MARDLKEFQINNPDTTFILIHGAGSFGHPPAKEYNLQDGWSHEQTEIGIAKTEYSVRELNVKMCQEFLEIGTPLFPISVSSLTTLDVLPDLIKNIQEKKMTPVLYGDIFLEANKAFRIVSGDEIIVSLTTSLDTVDRIISVGDTPGVLDIHKSTIPRINDSNWQEVLDETTSSQGIDVTGGMKGKLTMFRTIRDIPAIITSPELLFRVLNDDYTGSTVIL